MEWYFVIVIIVSFLALPTKAKATGVQPSGFATPNPEPVTFLFATLSKISFSSSSSDEIPYSSSKNNFRLFTMVFFNREYFLLN